LDCLARVVPRNEARRQQPDAISRLNERELQMHVVDFSGDHRGETGTLQMIRETCPEEAAERIEHPGCTTQASPIAVDVARRALNDLHAVGRNHIRQKRRRRGSS
jgi:hypothetical protein